MYSIFDSLKKPIVILGILIVGLLLVLTITSSISSIGSLLGFNTKENMAIKLEKTNTELVTATELLENNAKEDKVLKEIDIITKDKVLKDAVVVDNIKNEEIKVLEQIKNTKVDDVIDIPDTNISATIIKDKPTVVYIKKKLNNKQKLGLSILRDRAKSLKGNKV